MDPHKPAASVPAIPAIPELPIVTLVKRNRAVTWLAGITIALMAVLVFLPTGIRTIFWQGLQSQALLVSMLLIFSLVAISFVWTSGQRLDSWIFLTFNLRWSRPSWLDRIMLGFTQIGNGFATLAIATILLLTRELILAYELILGTLTLWFLVTMVKLMMRRSRPFIRLTQARIVGTRELGRSFPSGHTSQSFFIATLMIQHFHINFGAAILLYLIALTVGVTRMYVGAHYPRDVLAGAILGSAWGLMGAITNGYGTF